MIASYVGENKEFERQYLLRRARGRADPQGTLAERLRAGGAGIPAFFTATGVGTQVADGGLPWRYARRRRSIAVAAEGDPRVRLRRGHPYVLEQSIVTDFALVRARRGDRHGNLVFHETARNFNPLCAMAGRVTIAEVEELVEPGDLDPDHVHLPGHLRAAGGRAAARSRSPTSGSSAVRRERPRAAVPAMALTREQMAARAAPS